MTNEERRQIEERAYAIWEAEGRPDFRAEHHWTQAEAEMTSENAQLKLAGEAMQTASTRAVVTAFPEKSGKEGKVGRS